MGAGDRSTMDAPLIERRRHPIFPPVQALVLYVIVAIVVAFITYQWTQRADAKVEHAKQQADYERCVAGNQILENGNDQATVLRAVVTNIIEGRETAAKIAPTPAERRFAARSAIEYRQLRKQIKEYPTFTCRKDGSREEHKG